MLVTWIDSWFTLESARKIVDYSKGQQIRWISKYGDMGEAL